MKLGILNPWYNLMQSRDLLLTLYYEEIMMCKTTFIDELRGKERRKRYPRDMI